MSDNSAMKTLVLSILGFCVPGCVSQSLSTLEYRQALSYIDSSADVKMFIQNEALPEWSGNTFRGNIDVYDTALFSVASNKIVDYFVSKWTGSGTVEGAIKDSLTTVAVKLRDSLRSEFMKQNTHALPVRPPYPVSDLSHYVAYLSPPIDRLIVTEVLRVLPRQNAKSYGEVSLSGRGLRILFSFDDKGQLQSANSTIVHHN